MKKKIFALCVAACLILSACGAESGESSSASSDTSGSSSQENTSASTSADVSSVENETESEVSELQIGDTAELGDWSISVTGFELTTKIDNGYTYFSPGEGNQYGVVSVTVTNNGTEADSFLPSFGFGDDVTAKIYYNGQYEYSSTQLLAYDKDLHDEFLNPLSSASGIIAFELPDAVANGSESLNITFSAGTPSVAFSLK